MSLLAIPRTLRVDSGRIRTFCSPIGTTSIGSSRSGSGDLDLEYRLTMRDGGEGVDVA